MLYHFHRLGRALGYRTYTSQFKLHLLHNSSFFYPHAMVCENKAADEYYDTAPCLLAEIISERSREIDHFTKYPAYTSLPSLQTYLIAEQTERRVYVYARGEQGWKMTEYVEQGVISLPYLNAEITLDQIYDGVLPE